ncbi:hypothetical protein [Moorena sp. SIO3H5]|uniref:hypothetical protein n=1 Tax=Moorena sp. SIO3H5 TaxID=2607834 RepID=UPI0013BDDCD5|nr:hypothetical protein [Moorena sp. SIO3H5]NEO71497.1 hypothetical protein [Moorena sp. SIO3H5]
MANLILNGSSAPNSYEKRCSDSRCPTPDSLLPTPYSLLPTPYSLLPTPFAL